jgi:hypothetical protein
MISQVTSGPPLGANADPHLVGAIWIQRLGDGIPIDIKKRHFVDNEIISVIACGLLKKQPKQ